MLELKQQNKIPFGAEIEALFVSSVIWPALSYPEKLNKTVKRPIIVIYGVFSKPTPL